MTNELLELVPDHERAVGNKVYYEKELAKKKLEKKIRGDDGSEDVPVESATVILVGIFSKIELHIYLPFFQHRL
jgi:prolyl 4-hydroxylase